jgi:hypothetical protein
MDRNAGPRVYSAICAVTRALARQGIAKTRQNIDSGYSFRGIDDVYAALSPLFARHRLCMLPRVIERGSSSHRTPSGELLFSVWVRAAFDFVSVADGSHHSIETFGEAMDAGDKGTSKAMSAAFKYAAMQSFCIPVAGEDDADAKTAPRLIADSQPPAEGWSAWVSDLQVVILSCHTHEALDRVQAIHRKRLRALSRTEPDLYARLGDAIGERRASITAPRQVAA